MTIRPKYERQPRRVRKIEKSKADSKAAYEAVAARSGGICEGCGAEPATDMHHRLYRSRGGRDEVVNILHLAGPGNTGKCHGRAHNDPEATVEGWSVASWDDPADKPVLYRGRWVRLLPAAPWFIELEKGF